MSSYNVGKCTHTESINFSSELPDMQRGWRSYDKYTELRKPKYYLSSPKSRCRYNMGFFPVFLCHPQNLTLINGNLKNSRYLKHQHLFVHLRVTLDITHKLIF